MGDLCKDFVEVIIMQNPLGADKEKKRFIPDWDFWEMKWADVVFVSNINNFGGQYTIDIIRKAHELGKFIHFDTDDLLTELYPEHRLFKVYTDHQLSEMTKAMYHNSHMVTVTQTKFAELIKPYVRGVIGICRNAIDFSLPCWNVPKSKSKPVRIGWAGGIHHRPDVKVFAGVPHLVNQKVGKENVIWDFYGHPPPNQPKEEEWQIEAWDEYKQSLLKGMSGKPNYRIHNALPPGEYGVFYAHMDIAVAPLALNNFNTAKCFGKGEQVLLFDGSFKNVEDVVVGDKLMGPDSKEREVLSLSRGVGALYKISPENEKSFVVTNNHILHLRGIIDHRNISVSDYLHQTDDFKRLYLLYKVFPKTIKGLPHNLSPSFKFTVTYVGEGDYFGFKVTGDSLHLMHDFFVTHNSEIKLAECCAYNVPLVANDIGCYSDVLKSGKNGYLIRPNASPSEWVTVLSRLIKDKQHRETLGAELGKYKPFYDINNVVWDRLNLYAEVFTRKGWKFSD